MLSRKIKTNIVIDYLDEKYKFIKGLPFYIYNNGFCVFRDEEYWGHVNPIEITYTLVDTEGDEIGSSYKGCIKEYLKLWDDKYGKRKKISL